MATIHVNMSPTEHFRRDGKIGVNCKILSSFFSAAAEFNRYAIRSTSSFGCCCLHNKQQKMQHIELSTENFFHLMQSEKMYPKKYIYVFYAITSGEQSRCFCHRLFHVCAHRLTQRISRMVNECWVPRIPHSHGKIPRENHVHGVHGILFADSFFSCYLALAHIRHRVCTFAI